MSSSRLKRWRSGPLRVLVTGPDAKGGRGAGVSVHVRHLMNAFQSDERFEVSVFSATSAAGAEPVVLKGVRLLWKWAVFPVVALRSDVLHINASIDSKSLIRDLGFALSGWILRKVVVVQFHGGSVESVEWACRGLALRGIGFVLRLVDLVLFLSAEQLAGVSTTFGVERAVLVRNGVNVAALPFSADVDERLSVLFMSRLEEVKGLVAAVEGFLAAEIPQSTLVVAGEGALAGYVETIAEREPNVEFVGFVDGDTKHALLRDADCLVLPSRHDEGMPYAILEALAAATAVVATDRGATGELLAGGDVGLLLENDTPEAVARALRRLADDCVRLGEMKLAARARAERDFSYDALRRDVGAAWVRASQGRASAPRGAS